MGQYFHLFTNDNEHNTFINSSNYKEPYIGAINSGISAHVYYNVSEDINPHYINKKPYDKEITYLQSGSTQYIDTKFKHNQNTRFVCEIEYTNPVNWTYPFGSFGGASGTKKLYCAEINSSKILTTYYGISHNFNISAAGKHTYDLNKNVHKIDNTTYTFSNTTFQSEFNTFLFASTGYTNNLTINATVVKIYYFKIYDNGVLIRDFIPVRVGQIGYMYDKVYNQLYGNSGTGNFVLGPDKS